MMPESKKPITIYKIALLVAISCVLQIAESLIPHPVPGLRLGLANVITLIALVTMGFNCALEVTVLRTILSAFIMGSFMSPGFILSFAAGLASTLIMGFLYWLSGFHSRYRLSIVGISIIGALVHNLVQLYVVYLVLIKHAGIFVFFPWLCIGAVVMGWITGVAAGEVCLKLKDAERQKITNDSFQQGYYKLGFNHYSPGNSFIHRLPAEVKIACIFIVSLSVLFFSNLWFCAGLSLFLAVITIVSRTSFGYLLSRARRCGPLMFASFLLPVFFNSGAYAEGMATGAIFAFRIFFLVLLSSLLAMTTSPQQLSRGLSKIFSPRTAGILSLSWMAVPVFWDMARQALKNMDFKKVKTFYNLMPLLSEFIATLYLQTIIIEKEVVEGPEEKYEHITL